MHFHCTNCGHATSVEIGGSNTSCENCGRPAAAPTSPAAESFWQSHQARAAELMFRSQTDFLARAQKARRQRHAFLFTLFVPGILSIAGGVTARLVGGSSIAWFVFGFGWFLLMSIAWIASRLPDPSTNSIPKPNKHIFCPHCRKQGGVLIAPIAGAAPGLIRTATIELEAMPSLAPRAKSSSTSAHCTQCGSKWEF